MSRNYYTEHLVHESYRDSSSRSETDIITIEELPTEASRPHQASRSTHPIDITNVEHTAFTFPHPDTIAPSPPSSLPSISSLDSITTTSTVSTTSNYGLPKTSIKLHTIQPHQPRRSSIRPGIIAIKSYTDNGEIIVEQINLLREPAMIIKRTDEGALARLEGKLKTMEIGTNHCCLEEGDCGCDDVFSRARRWMPNVWEGWRRGSA